MRPAKKSVASGPLISSAKVSVNWHSDSNCRGILLAACIWLAGCSLLPPAPVYVGEPGSAADPEAGLLVLADGRQFHIRPEALRLTGNATYLTPDGMHYQGSFVDGLPEGEGEQRLPDGERYLGEWLAGQRHGQGQLWLADGSHYQGQFEQGMRQGEGVFTSSAGRYQGQWQHDRPYGMGLFQYTDGSSYEGEWMFGQRTGYGLYLTAYGARYEGDWLHDVPHGFGELREANGYVYDGQWQQGRRHGYGRMELAGALEYEGTWVADQRQGYGRERRVDGSDYEGSWHQDRRHGQGIARLPDGSLHDGRWEFDRPLGTGTRRLPTDIQITGFWTGGAVSAGILSLPGGLDYAGPLYGSRQQSVAPALLNWLQQLAAQHNAHAQLLLGDAYRNYRQPVPDLDLALYWYRQAADQGLAEAQYQLARLYLEQTATPAQALEPLLLAAEKSHAGAQVLLGRMAEQGELLPRNHLMARRYYLQATEAGSLDGRHQLAWLLATSSDDEVWDGATALRLIQPIALLFDDWQYLDTLAAALAAVGEFDAAIGTLRQALLQAEAEGDEIYLPSMQHRLGLYLMGNAFRQ